MNATPQQTTLPTPEEIAACAYAIWEREGQPHGRDVEHWLQAEAQLKIDRQEDSLHSVREAIAAALAANRVRQLPVSRRGRTKVGDRSRLKMLAVQAE